jgi:hypothetical protein
MIRATCNCVSEISLISGKPYMDPFNEVELDVIVSGPGGEVRLPAFWGGGDGWRFRFAPSAPGKYAIRSVCSDPFNDGLHDQRWTLEAGPYQGDNALLARGRLRVSKDRRHFEHADGTPFFWLGDTWWMGLCGRCRWPQDFQTLAADRKAKGFSVVQIVAGLYPDMPPFDPRGANEAGYPWQSPARPAGPHEFSQADFVRINPAYFDQADARMNWLVQSGLVPCIVGCWAYFLPLMGVEKMKKHWRYLVARYAALPVVWCLAGEGAMPYYLSKTREEDIAAQKTGWTELARYVRSIDPTGSLITIHPTDNARNQVTDPSVIDFDMLQTGHSGYDTITPTVKAVTEAYARTPVMPVINGEVNYEGIMATNRDDVQRIIFWNCILNGAKGHTYGANGIWQMNTRRQAYGLSPHGSGWGDTPWEDAFQLPGAAQVALGKKLLERYRWWLMEPHPEWVGESVSEFDPLARCAAGVPGEFRIFYVFRPMSTGWTITVKGLEPGLTYKATWIDVTNGREYPAGTASGENWRPPGPPIIQGWLLVLERQ